MKILAIEKEVDGTTKEQFEPYLKEEAQRVWELYKSEIIREFYFTKHGHNAVLMLECKNEIHAYDIIESLPLVKQGLINFQIIPLAQYDGLERLFEKI